MEQPSFLIISQKDIEEFFPISEAIKINKEAFLALVPKKDENNQQVPQSTVPDRLFLEINKKNYSGMTLIKPAHIFNQTALGLKVVSVRPENAQKGLPTVPGFVVLVNEETGFLEGLLDGTYLTAVNF